jgi:hypothetical protein
MENTKNTGKILDAREILTFKQVLINPLLFNLLLSSQNSFAYERQSA